MFIDFRERKEGKKEAVGRQRESQREREGRGNERSGGGRKEGRETLT